MLHSIQSAVAAVKGRMWGPKFKTDSTLAEQATEQLELAASVNDIAVDRAKQSISSRDSATDALRRTLDETIALLDPRRRSDAHR